MQRMPELGMHLADHHRVQVAYPPTIDPLSDAALLATLPERKAALAALYNNRKKLSATSMKLFAVEHMLPSALMLSHTGMGATLNTVYRKRKESDNWHAALAAQAEGSKGWRTGPVRRRRNLRAPAPHSVMQRANLVRLHHGGFTMVRLHHGGAVHCDLHLNPLPARHHKGLLSIIDMARRVHISAHADVP